MDTDLKSEKKISRLVKTPWWVLLIPALISFIVVTLVALLFLTRS